MAIFKCKMCGGALEIQADATIVECEYCGTKQTLPKLDDEKRANLYDRANHFRRSNEFDRAMGIYEQILNEDSSDAEAYWSLVLCRYGIEYVEDPVSHKRVPTVNRAQFTSIFADKDYQAALQHADYYQKEVYENEAKAIDEIQKGILAISQKEEPFDVFICYKETDNAGRRTPDSVLANDLYHQLTQEGFKVFFSRITLEDKLGSAYEPYIFAALHSAKVMVVLGTKPEYFNAVWVKNEWSRYLALIRNGAKKMLIPAYKDMDPYDLPEEFSHLQAQDMSKLGFMQDLIRGIKKIAGTETAATAAKAPEANSQVSALLKRAFIFLEDGDWSSADEYLEKVLDIDPENAEAYVGKLMGDRYVKKQEELADCAETFENNHSYQKALRYADSGLKATLIGYNAAINERNEHNRKDTIYQEACGLMSKELQTHYDSAADLFESIEGYLDADELAEKCRALSKTAYESKTYELACAEMNGKNLSVSGEIEALRSAILKFQQIPEYEDSRDKISEAKLKIAELTKKNEANKKRTKKTAAIVAVAAVIIAAGIVLAQTVILPSMRYNSANELFDAKDYAGAMVAYTELGDYKDAAEMVKESRYMLACEQVDNKEYENALDNFSGLKKYKDSADKLEETRYIYAKELAANKEYEEATKQLEKILTYEDSAALKNQYCYDYAKDLYEKKEYARVVDWYEKIPTEDRKGFEDKFYIDACYECGLLRMNSGKYRAAIQAFDSVGSYKDSKQQIMEAKYKIIVTEKNNLNATTYAYLEELKKANYKDSAKLYKELCEWNIELVCCNTDSDDYTTKLSYIPKETDYLHMQFKLTGGIPGEKITIYHKTQWPGYSKSTSDWDWEDEYVGSSFGVEWSDGRSSGSGTFVMEFYNAKDNSYIDKITIPVGR